MIVFRLIFGIGIGIGLCSEIYFVSLASGMPALLLELILLLAVVLYRKRAACDLCEAPTTNAESGPLETWLAYALGLLLVLDLAVFAWQSARTPIGGWDAWAIWNLRAHFLYRADGTAWRDAFTEVLDWSHPDYPLLLPAFVARGWKLLGRESSAVPVALACFFTFGCTGLAATSLAILQGRAQGLLAGLALAATPVLYVQGAMQCADVPVAFFRVATLAAMAMADRFNRRGFAKLAGMAAALDAWAKNEGLLWFGAFLLAMVIVTRRRFLVGFISGALPVLAPVLFFKARIATSSDIFGAAGRIGMLSRALDPSRYSLIAVEGLRHIRDFGPLLLSAFALLAIYLLVVGIRRKSPDAQTLTTGTLALLFTAAGYFVIYLLRPLDLMWLLETSGDRLLLQLWPGIVFVVFLAARAPHRKEQVITQLAERDHLRLDRAAVGAGTSGIC
jgi:hypothetical protein